MIRLGRMIPGATPLGIGISGAISGIAAFSDGEAKVIAKAVPEAELATELYCSLVAIELALPVAPPCLLLADDGVSLLFGSLNDGYPNFAQHVRLDPNAPDPAALERFLSAVKDWPSAADVASFDAWIDNRDRNPSNWLWRNKKDWLLIDHGKALGCDPTYAKTNKLHQFLMAAHGPDPRAQARVKRAMMGAVLSFSAVHAQLARDHLPPLFSAYGATFCAMLEKEQPNLHVMVNNLFPGQALLT